MATVLKRFSESLKFLRKQRSLTQEALAQQAKLHPGYISALERGTKIPTLITLDRLANGLKLEIQTLLEFGAVDKDSDRGESDDIRLLLERLKKCDPKMVRRIRKAVDALLEN